METSMLLARTGLSGRVLSRLLSIARVGVGFSILDVGCGQGELVGYLDSLGLHAVGIDESPANVAAARRNVRTSEFHCAAVHDPLPSLHTHFDLILVREASEFQSSLFSRRALETTAGLLGRLRYNGCLVFLTRLTAGASLSSEHRFDCYSRQAAALGERYEVHEIADSVVGARLRSMMRLTTGYGITLLRARAQRLSAEQWSPVIETALRRNAAPCCAHAASAPHDLRAKAA